MGGGGSRFGGISYYWFTLIPEAEFAVSYNMCTKFTSFLILTKIHHIINPNNHDYIEYNSILSAFITQIVDYHFYNIHLLQEAIKQWKYTCTYM